MPVLSINMLGRITIKHKNELVENKFSSKAIDLICYLLINSDKKISREKIANYLWADSNNEASRSNLRYCLWSIKRIILPDEKGEEFILAEKHLCYINEKYDFFSDILFLNAYENKNDISLEELLSIKKLYGGDFLEGLYINKCPEFNDLVLFERIVYQNKNIELLKQILEKYESSKRYDNCIEILKDILVIDPYNENFAYMLMDNYNKNGNRSSVISFYKNFESSLRRNLNISPEKELKMLYNLVISDSNCIGLETEKLSLQKKSLHIDTFCLKEIPFFWISDVIGKIVGAIGSKQKLMSFNPSYISDLASIQNKVLLISEENLKVLETVPTVRIINAFYEFLKCVCELHQLQIKILNYGDMDSLSKDAFRYIENSRIEGLEITHN
ncbi:BTAD domain-containing putative transcriptional regulator [Clostridium sp.]|uniref:AfsR/SARP family transcriptional regulator n=1 Tax=Clostridium sp. TaxID=1506 RepID=UPI001A42539B|nr:BTAD domain-containing putative transcriptional regulator [Clostridium sp.]MBK5235587.1 hypothetical protein [Clostridium sp.]